MNDDEELVFELDIDEPEFSEPQPEPEPLPPPQPPEDLKVALAEEHFLELSGEEQFRLVAIDMCAANQMLDAGLLEEYSGKYVAVLRRQLVGADEDDAKLRSEVSKRYAIQSHRTAIIFTDDDGAIFIPNDPY
jgi:hypothetical protein